MPMVALDSPLALMLVATALNPDFLSVSNLTNILTRAAFFVAVVYFLSPLLSVLFDNTNIGMRTRQASIHCETQETTK